MHTRILLLFTALVLFLSCKHQPELVPISNVLVKDVYSDSLSIRAIEVLNDGNLAFAANNGTYGLYNVKNNTVNTSIMMYDSVPVHFRAVAHTASDFFMLSIGNPALLYKTGDNGVMELVYTEHHEKVFYDSMVFWNDEEGIAMGDPTDDCLSVIITRDGGQTWTKLSCDLLPVVTPNEAAFAASNTNIAVVNNHTWIVSGGAKSNVYYSPDKGKSWQVYTTPIVQGESTQGIYSVAFYDDKNGIVMGGDYTKPELNNANKAITKDGGKTWQLVANNREPGYRSCVQYVPNSNAKQIVAVGFKGIDVSNDGGKTWSHLSDESFYTIRFVNDSLAYAAGKNRIAQLTFKRKGQ